MDDISREPRTRLAVKPARSVKGPAEVVEAAESAVDEVRRVVIEPEPVGDRLQSDAPDAEPSRMERPDEVGSASEEPPRAEPPLDEDDDDKAAPIHEAEELGRALFALMLTQREAIALTRLAETCGARVAEVKAGLERLAEILKDAGLPLEVSMSGDRAKLLTLPHVYPYVQRLKGLKKSAQLSAAALETLAVIAYRQPVIRAEIEAIRGVKAGPMLRSLLEHKLVKVVGRADVPGRPLQYGTTQSFLERFGLTSLKELPSVREFKSL